MDFLMKFVSRTSRCSILYRSNKLEKYGLNGHQHIYILNIVQNPGISQDQLVKNIYVNKSNVARQLAILEEAGFIIRTQSTSDRRQMQVYPTEKAIEVYPRVKEVLSELNSALLEDFSDEERALLNSMMERVMNKAINLVEQNSALY